MRGRRVERGDLIEEEDEEGLKGGGVGRGESGWDGARAGRTGASRRLRMRGGGGV